MDAERAGVPVPLVAGAERHAHINTNSQAVLPRLLERLAFAQAQDLVHNQLRGLLRVWRSWIWHQYRKEKVKWNG